jgi:hypothetical protein
MKRFDPGDQASSFCGPMNNILTKIEKDFLGTLEVPKGAYSRKLTALGYRKDGSGTEGK